MWYFLIFMQIHLCKDNLLEVPVCYCTLRH
jgi:hypothetical protein